MTNDDGIDAPGLAALCQSVVQGLGERVRRLSTIAPDGQRSELSHAVTSALPLRIVEVAADTWAVTGTPADCVRLGLTTLCRDVDLVFAGVNAGANLGTDLITSGTFAAAREAHLRGVPAIAISHYRRPGVPATWDHVPRWLGAVLDGLATAAVSGECGLWNVNLPAVAPDTTPPPQLCPVDTLPIPLQYVTDGSGDYRMSCDFHGRPRTPGHDVDVCFSGKISISRVVGGC